MAEDSDGMAAQDGIPIQAGSATPLPGAGASRAPVLQVGQVLQATVTAVSGDGRVRLGLLGVMLDARSMVPLEAGRSYEFTVLALEPEVLLRPAAAAGTKAPFHAGTLAQLGPGAAELAQALHELVAVAARGPVRTTGSPPAAAPDLPALATRPDLPPRAEELVQFARQLGHDQEARVLRLPLDAPRAEPEAALLRATWKALALAARDDAAREPAMRRAAETLLQSLNGIELENAQRSEQRQPAWVPLPLPAGAELRDARLFFEAVEQDGRRTGEAGPAAFRAVLLLELTRLGELRVDIEIDAERIQARFHAVEPSALPVLRDGFPALREQLERHGLTVGHLDLRLAANGQLPVADVRLRPADRQSGVVDLHA